MNKAVENRIGQSILKRIKCFYFSLAIFLIGANAHAQSYCEPYSGYSYGLYQIRQIIMGPHNLVYTNGYIDCGYYTGIVTNANYGTLPISISLANFTTNHPSYLRVYFDYINNGSFSDPGERIAGMSLDNYVMANINLQLPTTVTAGIHRLRIMASAQAESDPCSATFGEVQDYPINVLCPTLMYADADLDGYGMSAGVTAVCPLPSGFVLINTDCNDSDAAIHPGAYEIVGNNIDDNCNGIIDELTYCTPFNPSNNPSNTASISSFSLGTISNYTSAETNGYGNYTTLSTEAALGSVQTVTLVSNPYFGSANTTYFSAYIDYNNDGDFTDSNETIVTGSAVDFGAFTASFTIPLTAITGSHRMRVTSSQLQNNDACNIFFGEAEDYTINIICPSLMFTDNDADGYGTGSGITATCPVPTGYSSNSLDCNDNNGAVHPGVTEIVGNGIDDNCNGIVDENVAASAGATLSFDGSNDFCLVQSQSDMPAGNSSYTIEAMIFANSMGVQGIADWGNDGTNNAANGFRLTADGIQNYWWGNDLTVTTGDISSAWHHVAATYDNVTGVRSIYLDGALVGSDMPGTHNTQVFSAWTIGLTYHYGAGFVSEYFGGKIDELRMWNVARTQAQIQSAMHCEITTTAAGLVANYHFNQGLPNVANGSTQSLIDATGNGHSGQLQSFALSGTASNWVTPGAVPSGISCAANASLSNLALSSGILGPVFSSNTIAYTATATTAAITVTPTTPDSSSTIKVNGTVVSNGTASNAIALNAGSNVFTIIVTAPDGFTTKTYIIAVTRCLSPTAPVLNASATTNCGTKQTELHIAAGQLNDAANWNWYSGSCGGTFVGTGTTVSVSPSITTTYYAQGADGCPVAGNCSSITINVTPQQNYYLDTDNDGYYIGSPILACTLPGVGYNTTATVAGDCDDTHATAHQGLAEVGYDLIDNDCNGLVDEGFPPIVSIPLRCNYTLETIDTYVYSNLVRGATGYRWRVTTIDGPTAGMVQYLNTAIRCMKITSLGTYAFDTKYKIEVGVYYAGFLQPYTAMDCTVSTPGAGTELGTCNGAVTLLSDAIYANLVRYATGYMFKITDSENPLNTQELYRPIREFKLTQITNFAVLYNRTYNVEVAVKNTNGEFLPYTTTCTVRTPAFPVTSLQETQCDNYLVPSMSTSIYANSYPNVVKYVFLVEGPGLPVGGIELSKGLRSFKLSEINGVLPESVYYVSVRLIYNQNEPAGPHGQTCSIRTPDAAKQPVSKSNDVFSALAYPNPFSDGFNINLTTVHEAKVSIRVYDMTGRMLDNFTSDVVDMESLEIGQSYPAGIYNVIVSQGDEVKTLRVVKR